MTRPSPVICLPTKFCNSKRGHTHETNSEIMYIVSGAATFTVGDTVETVQAGQCHYCPKGGTHMLQNRGEEPLVFFAVVTEQ